MPFVRRSCRDGPPFCSPTRKPINTIVHVEGNGVVLRKETPGYYPGLRVSKRLCAGKLEYRIKTLLMFGP